jgi:hypothetical protein
VNPNVDLHIEEIVLHGFVPGDRYRIGDALERELSRLFAEHGTPPARGGYIGRLDGGEFEAKSDSTPEATGSSVARAVYRSLNP